MNKEKLHNIIFGIFMCMIMVCFISLITTKCVVGKSSIFGVRPLFILTDSMEPTIMALRPVMAVPIEAEEVKVGDIVTYTSEQGLTIVHRIIDISDDKYTFKGDNNSAADPLPVSPEQIGYKIVWYPPI